MPATLHDLRCADLRRGLDCVIPTVTNRDLRSHVKDTRRRGGVLKDVPARWQQCSLMSVLGTKWHKSAAALRRVTTQADNVAGLKAGQIKDIDERNEGIACGDRRCGRMRVQGCAEYT